MEFQVREKFLVFYFFLVLMYVVAIGRAADGVAGGTGSGQYSDEKNNREKNTCSFHVFIKVVHYDTKKDSFSIINKDFLLLLSKKYL